MHMGHSKVLRLGHKGLDLSDLLGGNGQVINASLSNDNAVLDTNTPDLGEAVDNSPVHVLGDLGVVLGLIEDKLDKVHTGLDSDNKASLELTTHAQVLETRGLDASNALGVSSDIVNIQSDHVTETVREENTIDVLLEQLLDRVFSLNGTSLLETLNGNLGSESVHVLPLDTGLQGSNDGLLHLKDNLVDSLGVTGVLSVQGEGTGDIRGVAALLGASIHQAQLVVVTVERGRVASVMKSSGVGADTNDWLVGLGAGPEASGLVSEKGVKLNLRLGLLGGLHQSDVGVGGDVVDLAHGLDLVGRLVHAGSDDSILELLGIDGQADALGDILLTKNIEG